MKIEIEIDEKQFRKDINNAVREYLEKKGLLRFIRNQIENIYASTNRRDLANSIKGLSQRLNLLEKK